VAEATPTLSVAPSSGRQTRYVSNTQEEGHWRRQKGGDDLQKLRPPLEGENTA
jgi:hypothetical protein